MQRLSTRPRGRLRDDRGAVSVVVALLMVPMIGFAAIAVDVAALYAERVQVQNGADAAALAIAQDCARGACGTPQSTAHTMTTANHDAHGSTLGAPTVALGADQVSVTNRGTQDHWFAPVLGFDSSAVSASATVRWGAPVSGTAVVPLIVSTCEFEAQTNGGLPSSTTAYTIRLTKSSNTGCTGSSGNYVPGGFGWLTTNGTGCQAATTVGQWVDSDPGNSPSNGCSASAFAQIQGQPVLIPVFQDYLGQGNNASYRVYGYAAFVVTGYYFAGQYSWNKPCAGSDRCIRGYFTRFVDLSDAFTYGPTAPDLGARVVDLIR